MEDMKILWETGVQILDEYHKDYFTLRAIIFVTINNYPIIFHIIKTIQGNGWLQIMYRWNCLHVP